MTINFTSLKRLLSPLFSGVVKSIFLTILIFLCLQSVQAGSNISLDNAKKEKFTVFVTELSISPLGQNLLISWQADKTAFNYYEVERSLDGRNFSTIGLVLDAPENSNLCMFKDRKMNCSPAITIWYRIKAIDKTGGVLYSNSSSYVIEKALNSSMDATAVPNPFTNSTLLKFNSETIGFAEVKVQNLNGQTLLSKQSAISKGNNSILLDGLSGLHNGIYIARLSINGTVIGNQKLIKN